MEVLIVAKTHMKNGFCVGGFDISVKRNIRLLSLNSDNQTTDTKFEVGQIWDMDYINRPQTIAPHIEDVLIRNSYEIKVNYKLSLYPTL